MMRRETAYRLAGRNHRHDDAVSAQLCRHTLRFAPSDLDAANRATSLLARIPALEVMPAGKPGALTVCYSLADHSLESIEALLRQAGFELDNSLPARLMRGVTHFCEETRLRNMRSPQRLIKQSNAVYIEAWRHHLHGDHDDTPPELRVDQ